MTKTIKIQHYVPQFYLRNFASQNGSTYFTTCFDKTNQKIFPANVDTIAAEKYFYDSDGDTNQEIERQLGQFETTFNRAYVKLLKSEHVHDLSNDELDALAYFIASQEVRTKEFREVIGDMIRQLDKRLSKEHLSKELHQQMEGVKGEGFPKEFQLEFLVEKVPLLASIVRKLKWVLFVNGTSKPYWTSDHPVNRYNSIDLAPFGNLGLLSPGIQIYFPLATRLALCICDPKVFSFVPEKYVLTDEQNVIFQNHLQVKTSTRHVFSVDKDFSLAAQMLKELPELGNIERQRVSIE